MQYKKKPKRWIACMLVFCMLFLQSGCSETTLLEEKPRWHIGVVLKTMDSEHWQGIRSGMENTAKKHNISLTILYPENEWAEDAQQVFIRDMLTLDIDALIVSPCNSTNTGWFVELAEQADISLFTADTRALDRDIPFIGVDNNEVGKMAAEYLLSQLGDQAVFAGVAGAQKQAQTIDRSQSFRKKIREKQPDKTIEVCVENSGFADAMHTTEALISKETDGVFCFSAIMGLGAVKAKEESGSDLCIVAVDTQDDALKAVKNGTLNALITQSGYEIGQAAIETVLQALQGKTVENTYVSCELVTKENVDEYIKMQGELR